MRRLGRASLLAAMGLVVAMPAMADTLTINGDHGDTWTLDVQDPSCTSGCTIIMSRAGWTTAKTAPASTPKSAVLMRSSMAVKPSEDVRVAALMAAAPGERRASWCPREGRRQRSW